MATLKDVQQAQSGGKAQPKESFFESGVGSVNIEPPKSETSYHIFRLVKKKRGRVHIDGSCDFVKNPKTGKTERIWLLRGAHSIWQSELGDLLKDKEYMRRSRRSLTFEDGICRIPSIDENALEYARHNTYNVKDRRTGNGKFDYYEYDAAAEQAARHKKEINKVRMVVEAEKMPIEKAKKLASFLGISFVDELGMPKGDEGIRTELMVKANSFPEQFAKYIDSQEVDIQYMVKRAIIEAKIDLTGQNGNALWAGGNGFIAKIPLGRKPYEYLTELAMTNSDEGRAFKEQLQTLVK